MKAANAILVLLCVVRTSSGQEPSSGEESGGGEPIVEPDPQGQLQNLNQWIRQLDSTLQIEKTRLEAAVEDERQASIGAPQFLTVSSNTHILKSGSPSTLAETLDSCNRAGAAVVQSSDLSSMVTRILAQQAEY